MAPRIDSLDSRRVLRRDAFSTERPSVVVAYLLVENRVFREIVHGHVLGRRSRVLTAHS